MPPFSSSQRKDFFLLLLRNKVAILLHCLYTRILIFFLKESGTYLFFGGYFCFLWSIQRGGKAEEEVPRGIHINAGKRGGGHDWWELGIRLKYPGCFFSCSGEFNSSSSALAFGFLPPCRRLKEGRRWGRRGRLSASYQAPPTPV